MFNGESSTHKAAREGGGWAGGDPQRGEVPAQREPTDYGLSYSRARWRQGGGAWGDPPQSGTCRSGLRQKFLTDSREADQNGGRSGCGAGGRAPYEKERQRSPCRTGRGRRRGGAKPPAGEAPDMVGWSEGQEGFDKVHDVRYQQEDDGKK